MRKYLPKYMPASHFLIFTSFFLHLFQICFVSRWRHLKKNKKTTRLLLNLKLCTCAQSLQSVSIPDHRWRIFLAMHILMKSCLHFPLCVAHVQITHHYREQQWSWIGCGNNNNIYAFKIKTVFMFWTKSCSELAEWAAVINGPYLSTWKWMNLFVNDSQEHLDKKCDSHENTVSSEKSRVWVNLHIR